VLYLTYIDSTQGWIATSGINEGTDALSPGPYSVDFLVVAGGGATSLIDLVVVEQEDIEHQHKQ
jgi:hypothetical protein